jgi:hypothetical protein
MTRTIPVTAIDVTYLAPTTYERATVTVGTAGVGEATVEREYVNCVGEDSARHMAEYELTLGLHVEVSDEEWRRLFSAD